MEVTLEVMRMLGGLLKREVARHYPEWTAAMALLTASEKLRIKNYQSVSQQQENERDCRTVVQQLVSLKPRSVVNTTPYKKEEEKIGTQKSHSLLRRLVKD